MFLTFINLNMKSIVEFNQSNVALSSLRNELLSELVTRLEQAGTVAKDETTLKMLKELKSKYKAFVSAKTKEKTNTTTVTGSQYLDTLKKRYAVISSLLAAGKNSGVKEKEEASAAIYSRFSGVSNVFALKSEATARMEKEIASLKQVDPKHFVALGADTYLAEIEGMVAEYKNTVMSRTDIKSDKTKSVEAARADLVAALQNLIVAVKCAQKCLGGAENELVKAFNTIFAEIATVQKKTSKKKAAA